ncbi:integrase core domain-containing protein [Bradyrhizobium sp. USDA 4451]
MQRGRTLDHLELAFCVSDHVGGLADRREKVETWRNYYNEEWPREAIGNRTPILLQNYVGDQ